MGSSPSLVYLEMWKMVFIGFHWGLWPSGGKFKGKPVGGTGVCERLMVRIVVYGG